MYSSNSSIGIEVCLCCHCIETGILLFVRIFVSHKNESNCLTVVIYVTIFSPTKYVAV
jgi:hypothetical protein